MIRFGVLVVGLIVAAFAIWHPVPRAPAATVAAGPASHPKTRPARGARAARVDRRSRGAPVSVVYVVGAVAHPGLYHVAVSARIDDAVRAAGGLLRAADPAGVNLAAHVADGDEVDVPRLGETLPRTSASRRAGRARKPKTKSKKIPSAPVDINSADAAALASVPGIGPAIAQRIAELREREGPYASFDELLDVSGMSPARLDRARPYLAL